MNFKEILELIDKVADRGITAIEIEQSGTKIRVEGQPPQVVPQVLTPIEAVHMGAQPLSQPAGAPALPTAKTEEESEAGLQIVTSPIVGTFYRSPNPEADPFIAVGDRISKGQVLCIVEAMKLMNEIEADIEGVIARIYPQNGQPIEYGEKLFAVRV